jgi:hypothetical protein
MGISGFNPGIPTLGTTKQSPVGETALPVWGDNLPVPNGAEMVVTFSEKQPVFACAATVANCHGTPYLIGSRYQWTASNSGGKAPVIAVVLNLS